MKKIKLILTLFAVSYFFKSSGQTPCLATGSLYTANYNSGWTLVDQGDGVAATSTACYDKKNGTISYAGTSCSFVTARCAKQLRLTSPIPTPSNSDWVMDFKVTINPPPSGGLPNNNPSVALVALSAAPSDIVIGCATPAGGDFCISCGTYPESSMDVIGVYLSAPYPNNCGISQGTISYTLQAFARDGNNVQLLSTQINIPSTNGTYYIRLQRATATNVVLSVFSNSNYTTHLTGSPTCFTIPASVTNLGYLSHEVVAQGNCFRTFNGTVSNLKIDNTLSCLDFTPSIAGNTNFCSGLPLTLTGSVTAGPATNHFWEILECNSTGGAVSGAYSWSSWYSGSPGLYTFPSNLSLGCNKYYKVKLAVQKACINWVETTKIIYISCAPTANAGPDVTICNGESANIGTNPGVVSHTNFVWTNSTGFVGNTAQLSVSPTTTTTYTLTVTNTQTGCSATDIVTVFVENIVSNFNIYTNNSNSSYGTITVSPNQTSGFPSGFGYMWFVSELDANLNPIWAVNSGDSGITPCWWPGNGITTMFQGINALGTLPVLSNTSAPTPGQFRYGAIYRITYGVWSANCDWIQTAQISTPARSEGGGFNFIEDTNAPDMSGYVFSSIANAEEESTISIYPNPSNGVFTVELEKVESGVIEVYDVLGNKVQTISVQENVSNYKLDMSAYSKGIYMLNVVSEGKKYSKKIILE